MIVRLSPPDPAFVRIMEQHVRLRVLLDRLPATPSLPRAR
jgi:hypothetical protein